MSSLYLRMFLLLGLFFGIIYAVVVVFASWLGIGGFFFYLFMALFIVWIQYMIGPKIVEWTMRVRYISYREAPQLFEMVKELASKAEIPPPKIGVSEISLPNAFAFGRSLKDGRICVTRGILNLLDREELRAVLGHEISHLKNRDVLFITLLSVIPLILYRIAFHFFLFGGYSRRRESGGYIILLALVAFIFYFLSNLLVLYASRIREYFADLGSLRLGNAPSCLATALYKLVYASAKSPKEEVRAAQALKAFFLNDVSRSYREISELSQIDLDRSGTIDRDELRRMRGAQIKLSFGDRLMEMLSTHPNMLKRIKQLSLVS